VTSKSSSIDDLKKEAALKAVTLVESGMLVGLGTGSTAKHAIDAIGAKLKSGELTDIVGIATSKASEAQAKELGIPLTELGEREIDLAIDGMDEITASLDAIKGLGGALTREKIVESRVKRLILISDDSKEVDYLGQKAPLPVEVIPFGYKAAVHELEQLCARTSQRLDKDGDLFITDNGNYIFDCFFDKAFDAKQMAADVSAIVGVVEHGFFLGMAERAFIALGSDGEASGIKEIV